MADIDFPHDPIPGQTFVAPSGTKYIFDGYGWVVNYDYVSPTNAPTIKRTPALTSSPVPPVSPLVNDLWYSTVSGFLFLWYNDGNTVQWVVANPGKGREVGPTGFTGPPGLTGPAGPPGPVSNDIAQHPYVRVEAFGGGLGTDDSAAFLAAAADGRVIALSGGTVYRVKNVVIPTGSPCPGIVTLGGKARIVPPNSYNPDDFFFMIQKNNGFVFEGLFFDMPLNEDPDGTYAFSRAVWLAPDGGRGTDYRVEDCWFSGAQVALSAGGVIIEDSEFLYNFVTGTFGDGFSFNTLINVGIIGNKFDTGGYASGALQPSGAIRINTFDQLDTSFGVEISGNAITGYGVASGQSAIDCAGAAMRGILITDNICQYNGAGIEIKTAPWVGPPPDVSDAYEDNVISGNIVRLFSDRQTNGITAFHAAPGAPKGKAAKLYVTGNMVGSTSNAVPGAFSHVGILVSGYDDVLIGDNFVYNTDQGIIVSGTGPAGNVADNVGISGNMVDVEGAAVVVTGGTVNHLYIRDNPLLRVGAAATGPAVYVGAPGTDIDVSGNRIENGAVHQALEFRAASKIKAFDNTIISKGHSIVTQGAAVDDMLIRDNELIAEDGNAVNIDTGTDIVVQRNDVSVLLSKRAIVSNVPYTGAGNSRGLAAANPTGTAAGSLGDTYDDSTAATAGWRCTVAGEIGAAVYVVI